MNIYFWPGEKKVIGEAAANGWSRATVVTNTCSDVQACDDSPLTTTAISLHTRCDFKLEYFPFDIDQLIALSFLAN